jgi:hypothetical protein
MPLDSRTTRRMWPRELGLGDFSGGLNLRDAPTELANNESPDLSNVTLDERGGLAKRLGYRKKNPAVYTTASPPQNLFEWKFGGTDVTQCGTQLFRDDTVAAVKTFSTSGRCGFAEFGSAVYAIHPVDGVYKSTDAITWTHILGSPKGNILAVWQTRMFAAGDTDQTERLYACAINDPLDWAATANRTGSDMAVTNGSTTVTSASAAFTSGDVGKVITVGAGTYRIAGVSGLTTATLDAVYAGVDATGVAWAMAGDGWTNDIREGNETAIVAVTGASGVDIVGRPGLLVYKRRSCHRVYDSTAGAYITIDPAVGAASPLAVVNAVDRTIAISERGIFWTDGNGPLQLASHKLQRLFASDMVALDQLDLWCAGAKSDRVYFSLPRAGSTVNDLKIEYHPQQGWFVTGSDAVSCYATDTQDTEKLYGGSPTVAGQVYEMGVGGTDDGADITARYQTKWIAPSGGMECQFTRVRVFGRGVFDLYTKIDFDTGDGDLEQLTLSGGALVWDVGLWDVGEWGPANYEDQADLNSLGQGTHISFVFRETSSVTASAPPLLGVGAAPEVGAFAVYGLDLQFVPIGV